MAKQQLGFEIPVTLAVLVNAATPDPGGAAAAGTIIFSSTEAQLLRWSGTAWLLIAPAALVATMTATQASTVVGLANITQLLFPMVANGIYNIDAYVTFQSAAITTGLNLGYTSPTGCVPRVVVSVPIVSTAGNTALSNIFPNAALNVTGNVLGTGVTAINSNHTALINGIVVNGATAGNFQLQFATEVGASAVTLQIGSVLTAMRLR